ncbi:MAG: outer membrane protein assembly factor BamE [Planctomycetes bacterium]|nr:outer membrane protein assembly factor BamE [Planctomycetota bacterium]
MSTRHDTASHAGAWIRSLLITVLAPLALGGCVLSQTSAGSSVDGERVEKILPGTSTRAQVAALLGPPDEIIHSNLEHDPLFERAYVYHRPRTRTTAMFLVIFSTHRSDTKYDRVTVFFDQAGIVEHVGVRLAADDAEYGMPW